MASIQVAFILPFDFPLLGVELNSVSLFPSTRMLEDSCAKINQNCDAVLNLVANDPSFSESR